MKNIRKIALALAFLTIFSLAACGETVAETTFPLPESVESLYTSEEDETLSESESEVEFCTTETEMATEGESETVIYTEESETAGLYSETSSVLESDECDTESTTTKSSDCSTTETEEISSESEEISVGLDITDRYDLVSICYSVWFDGILGEGSEPVTDFRNISEVLAGRQEWGSEGQFHYWGKPAQGYYRSTDKAAIRNNMTLLAAAGIDFIILDYTNANDNYVTNASHGETWAFAPLRAMCETIVEMRAEGKETPYIVLWCGMSKGALIDAFYERFYTVEEWRDCFVYWDGKPFMISTKSESSFPRLDLFTVRHMWGLTNEKCWRFLNVDNSKTVYINNGVLEQLSVAVATQETYMSEPTAHGRQGGRFFYEQWTTAFKYHPKVVTVTWWNEWAAQRFIIDGKTTLVDNYTQEYSRDIEPMEGGHGDLYYRWLCEYVRAYKAGEECPILVEKTN